MKRDATQDYLRHIGASERAIEGGLEWLVENWERVVDEVAKGYELDLDSYLNDLDTRQLIEEVLSVAKASDNAVLLERIAAADRRMKTVVKPDRECLWGKRIALEKGWTRKQNWWYFSRPISAGRELLDDLEQGSSGE
jgi:hypothetical protein